MTAQGFGLNVLFFVLALSINILERNLVKFDTEPEKEGV